MKIKLSYGAKVPYRAHPSDAGVDLFSLENKSLGPKESYLFDTGVAVQIPPHHVGLVFNRSSQGKIKVQLNNAVGVIDSDYRGNLKVLLTNNGDNTYEVVRNETRIAQLVVLPIYLPLALELFEGSDDEWLDTVRGAGGFGSTG